MTARGTIALSVALAALLALLTACEETRREGATKSAPANIASDLVPDPLGDGW